MSNFKLNDNLLHDGIEYKAGSVLQGLKLSDEQEKRLTDLGVIESVTDEATETAQLKTGEEPQE